MRLLVDIGNSRLKWALWREGEIGPQSALSHRGTPPADALSTLASALPRSGIAEIWAANVAGEPFARALSRWGQARGANVRFASSAAQAAGARNGYHRPEALGVDRWLALIAAYRLGAAPCWVVDCGTAVTLDALDAVGNHWGGVILPGQTAQFGALRQSAQALKPLVVATQQKTGEADIFARDTQTGVKMGILYATTGLIERAMNEFDLRLNETVGCLLTGGDAATVLPLLRRPCRHVPDLVLRGLAVLAGDTECV